MAGKLSVGARVRYTGDVELPEGYDAQHGTVVEVLDGADQADPGGQIAAVQFGSPGQVLDVRAADLERDPAAGQDEEA
jgi:hypothetical protein